VRALYTGIGADEVEAALAREELDIRDLAALLSPSARPYLEPMARKAQRLTRHHFGRTIGLYVPLYISNLCAADCIYCGFSVRSGANDRRVTLKPDAIRRECATLAAQGFEQVLLLTGEAPKTVTIEMIAEAVAIAREFFASVSVEVFAVDEAGYRRFVEAGLEGVTLYMETYDRETYAQVHLEGQKADYAYRIDAIERAGKAGVRKLSIGALLGLHAWREEVVWLALHARHLQRQCWQSAVALSFPRLRHTPARFKVRDQVCDADLVQIMLALRLFLPEAGFNLSTRESSTFRDRLIPLGVTAMSAGSSTRPGGYATFTAPTLDVTGRAREVLEQFEIEDHRSAQEVVAVIRAAGYDPVWKDYDHAFDCR
jgi:2-iminoacetate synthase